MDFSAAHGDGERWPLSVPVREMHLVLTALPYRMELARSQQSFDAGVRFLQCNDRNRICFVCILWHTDDERAASTCLSFPTWLLDQSPESRVQSAECRRSEGIMNVAAAH